MTTFSLIQFTQAVIFRFKEITTEILTLITTIVFLCVL